MASVIFKFRHPELPVEDLYFLQNTYYELPWIRKLFTPRQHVDDADDKNDEVNTPSPNNNYNNRGSETVLTGPGVGSMLCETVKKKYL